MSTIYKGTQTSHNTCYSNKQVTLPKYRTDFITGAKITTNDARNYETISNIIERKQAAIRDRTPQNRPIDTMNKWEMQRVSKAQQVNLCHSNNERLEKMKRRRKYGKHEKLKHDEQQITQGRDQNQKHS